MTVNFNGWWLQPLIFRTITPAITSFNHAVDRIRVAEDPETNLWTDVAFSVGTSLFVNMSNFGVTIKPKAFDITRTIRHLPFPNSSSSHPDPTIVGYIEPTNTMKFNIQYAVGPSSNWYLTNYTTTVKTGAIDTKLNMFPTDFIYVEQPNTLSYAARFTWEQRTQPITLVVEPAVLNAVEREWPAIQIHALMPSWRQQKFQPYQAQIDVWDGAAVKFATQTFDLVSNDAGNDTLAEWEAFYNTTFPQRFSAGLTDSINYNPPRQYGPARRYSHASLVSSFNQVQVPAQYREEVWQNANYTGYQFTRYFNEVGGYQGSVTLPTTFFNSYLNQTRTYTDINTYINEYWIPFVRSQFDGVAYSAYLCGPSGTLRLTGDPTTGCTTAQFGQVLYARYAGTNPVLVSTLANGNQNWSLRDYIEWYQTYAAPRWVATGNLPYFTTPPSSNSSVRYVLIANATTRDEQAGDDPSWTRIPWATYDFFYQEGRWYPEVQAFWYDFATVFLDVKPTDTATDRWIEARPKYYKHYEAADQGVYPGSLLTLYDPKWRPLAFGGEPTWPSRVVNYPGGERQAQSGENLTGKTTTQYPAQWVPWLPSSTSQTQPPGTEGVDWRKTQVLPESTYTFFSYSPSPGFLTSTDVNTRSYTISMGTLTPAMNGWELQGDVPGLIDHNSMSLVLPSLPVNFQPVRTIPAQVEFQYQEPERRVYRAFEPALKVYEPRVGLGTISGGTPAQTWASGNRPVGTDFGQLIRDLENGTFGSGRNVIDPRNFFFSGTIGSGTTPGLPPLSGSMWVRWLPFSEVGGGDRWRDPFPNEDLTGKTTAISGTRLVERWGNPGEVASTFVYNATEWRHPAPGQDITGRPTQNVTRKAAQDLLNFVNVQLLSRTDAQHVALDNPLNSDVNRPLRAKLTSFLTASSIAAVQTTPSQHVVLAKIAADQVALYRVSVDRSGNVSILNGPSVITQYNIATIYNGAWVGNPATYVFLVDVEIGGGQYRYALMRIDPTNLTQMGGLLFIFDDGPGSAPAEIDWATLSPWYNSFRIYFKSRVDGLLKRVDVNPATLVA